MTFRFDDVCINSDMELHNQMTDWLLDRFPGCEVIWAISPMVDSLQKSKQRVFPKIWNAMSNPIIHYNLNDLGIPCVHPGVTIASHGLVHADHRLLSRGAQELSILLSLSLIDGKYHQPLKKIFVPPFNKWNKDTEEICKANFIDLIKFEDGWESMEYNKFGRYCTRWYLHAREWTMESFIKWFE